MLRIEKYSAEKKEEWNRFAKTCHNPHFFFDRNYMDYHADRFMDHSLMFFSDETLLAILPGNSDNGRFVSHGGLSFGGLLYGKDATANLVLDFFSELKKYLLNAGFNKLSYKCIPYIYHSCPAQEDLYALFRQNTQLRRRDLSVAIDLEQDFLPSERRLRGIKKATKNNLEFKEIDHLTDYWKILSANLQEKYHCNPTHKIAEIQMLQSKFPNQIRLYGASLNSQLLAGVLMFQTDRVAHAQYIASTEGGREMGALDLTFSELINFYKNKVRFFSFGISTEDNGTKLNSGLIEFKESFGARAVVHDFYDWDLTDGR